MPKKCIGLVNIVGHSYWVPSNNENLELIKADFPNTIVADCWSVANKSDNLRQRDKTHPNETRPQIVTTQQSLMMRRKDKISRVRRAIGIVWIVVPMLITSACATATNSAPAREPIPSPTPVVAPTTANGLPKSVDPVAVVSVKDYKLASKSMGRLMPYRVILPVGYSRTAPGYPVIYLLHGLTGNYKDWTDRTELVKLSAKYQFIIVTVEGENGWYTDSAIKAADRFESHLDEIVLETDKQFNTNRSYRVIAGLSMGGYGALKFALRRPGKFALIGSFSGAFGIPQWSETAPGSKLIGRSIDAVFGPIGSPAREQNNISKLVGDLTTPQVQALPYIYISCGTEDAAMIKLNRDFVALLEKKGLRPQTNFQAVFRNGIHDWVFWGSELATFLDLVNTRFTSNGVGTTKAAQQSP